MTLSSSEGFIDSNTSRVDDLQNQKSAVFGTKKVKQKHILILAKGDHVRHMVVQPWALLFAACIVAVMLIGHLGATTYLVIRDDLVGATMAKQARMQHAYEDKIALLRQQLDRATSRQLLNQQLVQDKVAELMARQNTLSVRHGQISPILDRAGLLKSNPLTIPVPAQRSGSGPQQNSDQASRPNLSEDSPFQSAFVAQERSARVMANNQLFDQVQTGRNSRPKGRTLPDNSGDPLFATGSTRALFGNVALSLELIEQEQMARMNHVAQNANKTLEQINIILENAKLPKPDIDLSPTSAIGGPFLPPQDGEPFDYSLRGLDEALTNFNRVVSHVENLPLGIPVYNASVSSYFGHRQDPFLKRRAFHAGIDFRAATGTDVRAAAKGKVIFVGRKGGFGKMVQIDHGNGLVTRYAHLSRILVNLGDYVDPTAIIGKVGSTGRSTGPHLHYEIRHHGKAVNPSNYLRAGSKLRPLLKQL